MVDDIVMGDAPDIVLDGDIMNSGMNIDAQHLLKLAKDKTEESYKQLANEVADIYNNETLTEDEYKIANDILFVLLQQAEIDLREALAERLSVQDNIPQELVLRLAYDDISVASHVILNSRVLSDLDLMGLIKKQGEDYWQVIAQRKDLSTPISSSLAEVDDVDTLLHLIKNSSTVLSDDSMLTLSRSALRSEKMHVPLLNRPEVNNEVALNLYMYVSRSLRHKILDTYNINREQLDKTLESLLVELHSACYDEWDVTDDMITLAQSFLERNEISSGLLIKTLRRGQLAFFVALMSIWLDMDINKMRQTMKGDDGKSFAIACRSLGIVKSEFATIFLLSNALHTGNKTINQTNLLRVLKFFDRITTPDAQKFIRSWAKKTAKGKE